MLPFGEQGGKATLVLVVKLECRAKSCEVDLAEMRVPKEHKSCCHERGMWRSGTAARGVMAVGRRRTRQFGHSK